MKELYNSFNDASKSIVDTLSMLTVIGTLMELLPALAALFSIVWTVIRIYETKTVQSWFSKKDAIDK